MIDVDYPAAHSMDAHWWAVDRDGRVGLFDTGENGSLPTGAANDQQADDVDPWELISRLRQTRADPAPPEPRRRPRWSVISRLREMLERPPAAAGEWDLDVLAPGAGIFFYRYEDNWFPGLYRLVGSPACPLHVDELPPSSRERLKSFFLGSVRFDEAGRIQPFEFGECSLWDDEQIGYLCTDGVTVRPIPGREDAFPGAVERFRRAFPREAARFRFEGFEQ